MGSDGCQLSIFLNDGHSFYSSFGFELNVTLELRIAMFEVASPLFFESHKYLFALEGVEDVLNGFA